MYDWELKNYLECRNNILTPKEYSFICNSCPQINWIKFNGSTKQFYIRTDDRNEFLFDVKIK